MTLAYTVNEKDVLAVKCQFSSAGTSPGAIWAQFKPKQTNEKTIPAHAGTHFNPWV